MATKKAAGWETFPWATFTGVILSTIVAVVGGVAVVTGDLEFDQYMLAVVGANAGNGLLAVGRGIFANNKG